MDFNDKAFLVILIWKLLTMDINVKAIAKILKLNSREFQKRQSDGPQVTASM